MEREDKVSLLTKIIKTAPSLEDILIPFGAALWGAGIGYCLTGRFKGALIGAACWLIPAVFSDYNGGYDELENPNLDF